MKTEKLIDKVTSGTSPKDVLESITVGMRNAYARMSPVMRCSSADCGLTLPKYRGRYPSRCPSCGCSLIKNKARI